MSPGFAFPEDMARARMGDVGCVVIRGCAPGCNSGWRVFQRISVSSVAIAVECVVMHGLSTVWRKRHLKTTNGYKIIDWERMEGDHESNAHPVWSGMERRRAGMHRGNCMQHVAERTPKMPQAALASRNCSQSCPSVIHINTTRSASS